MPLPEPKAALVIRYNYLWAGDAAAGQVEGGKVRPCAVIVATQNAEGEQMVFVAPITHSKPANPDHGIEIPDASRRRLGLDDEPCWVITTELNKFVWPGPDLRTVPGTDNRSWSYGYLPGSFFDKIKASIIQHQQNTTQIVTP